MGGEPGQAERKPLTYVGEVFGILAEELGKNGLPLEPFFILKDVAVHEAIHHGGVGVDVNIKLQACFLLREGITNEKSGVTEFFLKGTRQITRYMHTPHTHTFSQAGPTCQLIQQLLAMHLEVLRHATIHFSSFLTLSALRV